MAQTAELDVAPDTIEATLNYIVDDGSKIFTIVGSPGGSDTRSGGTADPHRVTIHNGRLAAEILRWSGTASASYATTPKSPIFTTRRKSGVSIIRRWKR